MLVACLNEIQLERPLTSDLICFRQTNALQTTARSFLSFSASIVAIWSCSGECCGSLVVKIQMKTEDDSAAADKGNTPLSKNQKSHHNNREDD